MNCIMGIQRIVKISRLFFPLFVFIHMNLFAASEEKEVIIPVGQSDLLNFETTVQRVAIADPEIADVTMISPSQILIVGKMLGVTSLIIWMEGETTVKYLVKIQNESSVHQIMLHVKFMEINKNALKEWGTDFLIKNRQIGDEIFDVGSFGGKVTGPSDPLNLGNAVDFFFNIPSREVSAMIQALHENNLLSILAAPNLSAMSGEEASFLAGGEFPIPIVSGSMGTQTVTIQYKEFGIKLRFIPTVMDSDLVNIKVAAEVSSLDFENGIELSGFRVPSLMSRKTETTVELKEGEYLIIGGLLSNEVSQLTSKIPILGDIPVLGALFSSRRYLNKESELLITLTPRIIQSIQEDNVPELHLPEM